MDAPVTKSSLEVAYWFFNRAEQDNVRLDIRKMHHLLFFAQMRYTESFKTGMFMPCLFLCDEEGFYEPTLKGVFAQGVPFMPVVKFDAQISDFLENIWQEFGSLSNSQCARKITSLPLHTECFKKGTPVVIACNSYIDKVNDFSGLAGVKPQTPFKRKVLLSQNGPVWVSQWNPRKINNIDNKGLRS